MSEISAASYRRRMALALVVLVAAFIALLFTSRTKHLKPSKNTGSTFKGASNSNPTQDSQTAATVDSKQDFEPVFEHEAEAIGRIDEQPAQTEERLREWASNIPLSEFPKLQEKALNLKLNGDSRFLAVQLLGWTGKSEALSFLENIASNSIPPLKDERALSFETTLRALAIESIGGVGEPQEKLASLARVARKSEDRFLNDRAERTAAWVRDPSLRSPIEQDRLALGQIVDN